MDVAGDGVLDQEEENPFIARSLKSSALRAGLESTLNRLSKWLVAVLFVGGVVVRHDAEALWAALGSVLNTALSVILKMMLNHERPNSARNSGPGMPSTHTQAIFYSVVFIIWSLIQWLELSPLSSILGVLVSAFGSYLSWLRVSQRYHTISQVAVGAVVGSGFALARLWSWDSFVFQAFVLFLWVRVVVALGAGAFFFLLLHSIFEHQGLPMNPITVLLPVAPVVRSARPVHGLIQTANRTTFCCLGWFAVWKIRCGLWLGLL